MSKITDYTTLTAPANGDFLPIVDVSDFTQAGTGTTKKITVATVLGGVNVLLYGADPTGATDSAPAFQAAINAAQVQSANDATFTTGRIQAVYVPYGTYLLNSALTPQAGQGFRLIGDGAKLVTTSNGLINFNGAGNLTEAPIEISGFSMDVTGGHVFANPNIHGAMHLHHLNITQRSTGFAVFYMDDVASSTNTALYKATFSHINYWLGTGTRTVEAWRMVSATGANITDVLFENVNGPNPPGATANDASMDTSKYQFYLTSPDTGYMTNITWRNCLAADVFGGLIKIANAKNVTVENFNVYNTFARAITNDLIAFANDPTSGNGCINVAVRNVSRNNALGNGAPPPPYDISATSATTGVLVENCAGGGHGNNGFMINNGSAAQAVYINNVSVQSGYPKIDNKASDTIVIGTPGILSVAGTETVMNGPSPATAGYLGWGFDPVSNQTTGGLTVSQTLYMMRLDIQRTITITKLWFYITAPGTGTATAGDNFIGIYNSSGTLLKSVGIDALYTAGAGIQSGTVTSQSLTPGFYYVGILFVGTAAPPTLARSSAALNMLIGSGVSNANLRFAINGTANTALPSPATLSSNNASGAFPFWTAVS